MYLYYDNQGILKEFVDDNPFRQADVGDKIYLYIEDANPLNSITVRYKLPSGTILPLVEVSSLTVEKEIPFNNRRDLKFFKYNTPYPFYEIPTAFVIGEDTYNALSEAGTVEATFRFININLVNTLGMFVFNVQESTDGDLEIQQEEYISLAQFYYLLENLTGKMSNNSPYYLKVVSQGTTEFSTDDYNNGDLIVEKGNNILQKLTLNDETLSKEGTKLSLNQLDIYSGNYSDFDMVQLKYENGGLTIDIVDELEKYKFIGTNIYILTNNVITDTFVKLSYLTSNYYNKTQVEELIADVFEMTSSPMVLTNTQYNELANNPNKVIEYQGIYHILFHDTETYSYYRAITTVENGENNLSINTCYISLNKSLKTLTHYSSEYLVYSTTNADNKFYSKEYIDTYYYDSDEIDHIVSDIKANTFQVVSQLPQSGQEGIIYLVPIDSSDLTKGYTQYIWEGSDYINIGTTQIDLSNYYTKSETYSKTEVNNTFVPQTRTIAGSPLNSNISASTIQSALFDITVVEVVERD